MRSLVMGCAVVGAVCALSPSGPALAAVRGDICSAPTTNTEKWHRTKPVDGLSLLLPPGVGVNGLGGGRRAVDQGMGPGPSMLTSRGAQMSQMADCQININGRNVEITTYTWIVEDDAMAPSGQAGSWFRSVARFLPTGSQREMYVLFQSKMQGDLMAYRGIFWSAQFEGAPSMSAEPAPSRTVAASLTAAAPAAVAAAPAPAAPVCVPKPDPTLPAASAVVDSALVQMLISGAGPMPKGFAVMSLKFDGASLAGLDVSQSDLPDAAQKQIATLVASNLKPHDAKSPKAFMLRVDSQDAGLHYAVQGSCAQ
jgi:hypothetical protein